MRIEEIKSIAARCRGTHGIIEKLCTELLKVHDVNSRMASEIADLRARVEELHGLLDPEQLEVVNGELHVRAEEGDETFAQVIEQLFNATPVTL